MSYIILFRGKAGVGKSEISTKIGEYFNYPIIRKDDIYDSLASVVNEHESRNILCRKVILEILRTNKTNGINFILDYSLNHSNQIEIFRNDIVKIGYNILSFLCTCNDINVWQERFEKRKLNPKPNNLITDFGQILEHYKNVENMPIKDEILLDTTPNIKILIGSIIRTIKDKIQ